MSRYYSLETIRANAYDVTLANGAKHRCIDPDALLDIEPADVRENVKGEWRDFIDSVTGTTLCRCSNCGGSIFCEEKDTMKFCYNCGADMRTD